MNKPEMVKKLIVFGCEADDLKDKKKDELQELLNDWSIVHTARAAANALDRVKIVSKRDDCYWMEDGSKRWFKDLPLRMGYNTPFYKAGDYLE